MVDADDQVERMKNHQSASLQAELLRSAGVFVSKTMLSYARASQAW